VILEYSSTPILKSHSLSSCEKKISQTCQFPRSIMLRDLTHVNLSQPNDVHCAVDITKSIFRPQSSSASYLFCPMIIGVRAGGRKEKRGGGKKEREREGQSLPSSTVVYSFNYSNTLSYYSPTLHNLLYRTNALLG